MDYLIKIHVFDIVLNYLEILELKILLLTSNYIRKYIGCSNIWLKFKINHIYNHRLTYFNLCKILSGSKLYPNTIKIRDYYSDPYYMVRYQYLYEEFNEYFYLNNILNSSVKDIKKFKECIILPYIINTYTMERICFLNNFIKKLKSIKLVLFSLDPNFTKYVRIKFTQYDLQNIIIDVKNDLYTKDKYIPSSSEFMYDINTICFPSKYCNNIDIYEDCEYILSGIEFDRYLNLIMFPSIYKDTNINKYGETYVWYWNNYTDNKSYNKYIERISNRINMDKNKLIEQLEIILKLKVKD